MKKFWQIESGSYKIDPASLHTFLEVKGYCTFKPSEDSIPIYVRIRNNKVQQVSKEDIRDYCWDYINNTYKYQSGEEMLSVRKEFLKSATPFSRDVLDLLKRTTINELKDTKEKSYLFFRNCILEISADGVIKKGFDQINGHVWEKDLIKSDLKGEIPKEIIPSGEFFEFFKDITKHSNKHVEAQNRDSLLTIIGYLLHRYKDPLVQKAVILMDSFKDGYPQGGTGKGIFGKALSKIRSRAFQNGKQYKPSERFAFSNVTYGTRILQFDDVPKNFDFERLFPTISEETVVERKYKDKFSIPYDESPKVLISTNYTIGGQGASHRRRKVEFILSDTYSDVYTPEHRFGHRLFDDWNEKEWEKFYLFMAHCIQMFLLEGIVPPDFNVAERALKQNASREFLEYANGHLEPVVKYNKKNKYEDFLTKFPRHANIEQNTFTKWIKFYADAYNYEVQESHSGPNNFFELVKREGKK